MDVWADFFCEQLKCLQMQTRLDKDQKFKFWTEIGFELFFYIRFFGSTKSSVQTHSNIME